MRRRRYLLLFLCLLVFAGCAGKKCKRCNGGGGPGGGGGGGAPKAGKGTHGDGQRNDDGLAPAPGLGNAGQGPSNEQPFGSQFVPFNPNGGQGEGAPGVSGSGLPPEVDPNNLPTFPPPGTQGAPGFGGAGTATGVPSTNFAPSTFPPSGGTDTAPGNLGVHPGADGSAGDARGPLPSFSPNPSASRPTSPALHTAMGKCVACHKLKGEELSELMKDPNALLDQFATMDPKHLEDMISRTSNLTPEELAAIRQHAADTRGARAALTAVKPGNARAACFMTDEQRQQLLLSLPPVTGNSPSAQFLQQSQKSGNIQFYDRTNVPLTWQTSKLIKDGRLVAESTLMGPHNATNPDMISLKHYHSDGAREFPWKTTAGLDISPSGGATKFVIPPPQGPMMQVIDKNRQSHPTHFGNSVVNANGPQMGWVYAPGTTFGETLRVLDSASGQMIPFEIRLRTKLPNGTWNMDVLRPFANSKELAAAVKQLCAGAGAPAECATIQVPQRQLENPQARVMGLGNFVNATTLGTKRDPLSLSRTALEAAQSTATIETLPELPASIVRRLLLETPFKSVFGQPWSAGPPPGWAPTSASDFNIVPRNYFAGFIPMNQNGCMKCHDSAGRHVDQFDPGPGQMFDSAPNDAVRARTWYNHIPGDDGILSFHPYSASSVAGGNLADKSSIDPCWVQSGLLR